MSEIDEANARIKELETAISDALSALGIGRCFETSCPGCDAERDSARESLSLTGVRPSGFENYSEEAQEEWNQFYTFIYERVSTYGTD